MVNQTNSDPGREIDKRTNSPRSYINQNRAVRNIDRVDDVIAALANAHENRRARQVNEWERMFRQPAQRAA